MPADLTGGPARALHGDLACPRHDWLPKELGNPEANSPEAPFSLRWGFPLNGVIATLQGFGHAWTSIAGNANVQEPGGSTLRQCGVADKRG
jgi:hypothetical protein